MLTEGLAQEQVPRGGLFILASAVVAGRQVRLLAPGQKRWARLGNSASGENFPSAGNRGDRGTR